LKNDKRLSFYAFFPTARAFFEKICSKSDVVDAGAEWTSHASGIGAGRTTTLLDGSSAPQELYVLRALDLLA